ncbi:hypothetical protein SAMN02746062_01503 [Alysiella filiformis DSM 16848]|uniref:Uncharacterized protein n=1 Tax=Alysiella filiformis DSM 16848 TaxID=1120981 RepID=A0A286EDV6_9NEIS|nr:hypothetical protein SAMN02746062_01503 [Alysiella filiformis DSM 16848]
MFAYVQTRDYHKSPLIFMKFLIQSSHYPKISRLNFKMQPTYCLPTHKRINVLTIR